MKSVKTSRQPILRTPILLLALIDLIMLAARLWPLPNFLGLGTTSMDPAITLVAYIGLGFSLRGTAICNHQFGTLTNPETFGNYGAGSTLIWVDPELDISFAACSAGVMKNTDNIERFQKLGDLVVSAMV